MLIPYQLEPPADRMPSVTVCLIVLCACGQVLLQPFLMNPDWYEYLTPLTLQYGGALNPLQWVTSFFLHMNWIHFVVEMCLLWVVGNLLELRLGTLRFVALVAVVGLMQAALEQSLAYWLTDWGIGSSGVIYALAMVLLVVMPVAEARCLLLWKSRRVVHVPIVLIAPLAIVTALILGPIVELSPWTQLLRLLGLPVGFVAGAMAIRYKLVPTYKQDLFTALEEWRKPAPKLTPPTEGERVQRDAEFSQRHAGALAQIRDLIANGRPETAFAAHQRMQATVRHWSLPQTDFVRLIAAYHEKEMWSQSIPVMVAYVRAHNTVAPGMRIRLAALLLEQERRPAQAMQVLGRLERDLLRGQELKAYERLENKAKMMMQQNPYEMIDDSW